MALLIAGHQRSGTTLTKDLCNSHPDIAVTGEFGNFMRLDLPVDAYVHFIVDRWWRKRNAAILDARRPKGVNMGRNFLFIVRYLRAIGAQQPQVVDAAVIETALKQMFPGKRVVGDKYPDHVFQLNKISRNENIQTVFIYRDPRDVASSALKRARSELRNTWPDELRSPRDIAERWLQTIQLMENNQDRILAIRYEDLVNNPLPILQRLGECLNVDPQGFDHTMIRPTSVGKHRSGLTDQEVQEVLDAAGPAMERLGYISG
jgi:hypothetical protein